MHPLGSWEKLADHKLLSRLTNLQVVHHNSCSINIADHAHHITNACNSGFENLTFRHISFFTCHTMKQQTHRSHSDTFVKSNVFNGPSFSIGTATLKRVHHIFFTNPESTKFMIFFHKISCFIFRGLLGVFFCYDQRSYQRWLYKRIYKTEMKFWAVLGCFGRLGLQREKK